MYWRFRYHLRNNFKGWYWKKANQETRHSYQKVTWKHHQLCLNVNFVLVPKGSNRNNTRFVLVLKGSSQLAEKLVVLARIGHIATTWCSFLSCWKRKQRKYRRIMGNSCHITHCFDLNLMHHYTRSAKCVEFCQRLCLVVRVDLMFVTAGNETDHAHKIWRERLLCVKHISARNAWV